MNRSLLAALAVLVGMAILDFLWIGVLNKSFYSAEIQRIQGTEMKVNIPAALLSYVLVFASVMLVAVPLARKDSAKFGLGTVLVGALVGLCTYGIYNLTNKATFSSYSWNYVIRDTLWGMFLTAVLTSIAVLVYTV